MCTCITYHHYFGRNLDLDHSYQEEVTITPRHLSFHFRNGTVLDHHPAMIGMAYNCDGYPLYYDATNEYGLSIAGLNFPNNAVYTPAEEGRINVAAFELIPWLLAQYQSVAEVKNVLPQIHLTNEAFAPALPSAPLHWMIADQNESIVFEVTKDGNHVYDDPIGVMTNNPTFDIQLWNLTKYRSVSSEQAPSTFATQLQLDADSLGMSGIGLPGDWSSSSRFVKAAFTKLNSAAPDQENHLVSQFFHILGAVEQPRGCSRLGDDKYEITIYSSCCDMETGIYYYHTYDNSTIHAVDLHAEDLNTEKLIAYRLVDEPVFDFQNR
ncbi:choloylglycine hydrolase [Catenisphaera adipataccumulans]|jgi:choloylglycine hydrolase|uniref:choloylglycine hydrolase n=1 Tax=Catenisphaera adipataccumulans TaxID=700500 RepID=A0A7W8FV37_9FIRM|nr:choloylglycine hydrolase [Catenisphaera adipataccumulans]MBB5183219.1 choloylglycine hydrolase [Catenisphaera adipataccumulans]